MANVAMEDQDDGGGHTGSTLCGAKPCFQAFWARQQIQLVVSEWFPPVVARGGVYLPRKGVSLRVVSKWLLASAIKQSELMSHTRATRLCALCTLASPSMSRRITRPCSSRALTN